MTEHARAGEDAACCTPDARPSAQGVEGGLRLRVHGMDCAEEVAILKRALADVAAPEALGFDTLAGIMEVPSNAAIDDVKAAVAATGMRAVELDEDNSAEASWWEQNRLRAIVGVSGVGTLVGFFTHAALGGFEAAIGSEGMTVNDHGAPIAAVVAFALAVFAGLALVGPKAWYAARTFRPDMNLLMTLAVAGAVSIGEWFEAATVSFLFALSIALESWSVGRARNAVEKLLALAPTRVRVKRDGEIVPSEVAPGSILVVKPGERFGLDGVVVEGETEVDQAPITGESLPVEKGPGDEVFAGTINGNAAVEVRSTSPAEDTTLSRIVKMVGEARQDRSSAEQWVERFARVYTPMVFGAALLVLVGPPLLLGASWQEWFYRSLVLLVIGCPCALVISTPVAVVAGLAASAPGTRWRR